MQFIVGFIFSLNDIRLNDFPLSYL